MGKVNNPKKGKKIIMFAHYYYPHVGGVEKHIYKLCSILRAKDYYITLITSDSGRCDEAYSNIFSDILLIRLRKIKYLGLLSVWFSLLKYFQAIKNADIVHVHDVFVWYLPFLLIFPQKRVYITFHGYENYPLRLKHILLRRLGAFFTRGNICVGKFIEKWYGIKATEIIYGAIDQNDLLKESKLSVINHKYDAIYVGRLENQNDFKEYVKFVSKIRIINPKFKLIILGDGEMKEQAEKIGKWRGFVKNPSMYLKETNVMFASRYLAIIEGLLAKQTIYAIYSTPIKKDYLEMTPFRKWIYICSNADDAILIYKKRKIMTKSVLEEASKWAGRQTWKHVAEKYESLWKN